MRSSPAERPARGPAMRLFLITVHVVLAAGILYAAAARPDVVTLPGAVLLIILGATCAGLWLDRRWAAAPAVALAFGAGGTAVLLAVTRGLSFADPLVLRIVVALAAVVVVEFATVAFAFRRRPEQTTGAGP